MLRHRSLLVVAAITLLASACDTPKTAVGMTLDGNGDPVAVIKPCHADATIFAVSIKRFSDNSLVWEITSDAGTRQRSFPIGVVPPGFQEVVPYDPRALQGQVQVTFKTSELPGDYANIDVSNVHAGTVLLNGKQVTMTAFDSRNTCG